MGAAGFFELVVWTAGVGADVAAGQAGAVHARAKSPSRLKLEVTGMPG